MLCCIGDLVEDVVVWLGSDIAVGTDTSVSIRRRRGGSASNVAAVAASRGVDVRFIGRVGSDAIGHALVEELRGEGVDVRPQFEGTTGTIVVLVDRSGERTMLPDRGAAVNLDVIGPDDLSGVTWLHLPAYSLVSGPLGESSRAAIETIRRTGGTVSIDVSSVALIDEIGPDVFGELMGSLRPDVVFCNREEASRLDVASNVGVPGAGTTIVKSGPEPAVVYVEGSRVGEVPVPHIDLVRDTTGAGDAFAAGYIAATMSGEGLVAATGAGHAAAAQILVRHSS